ncbi:MAG: hypothetical protein R2713_07170 [Ilumatobacteraceae bacterium]
MCSSPPTTPRNRCTPRIARDLFGDTAQYTVVSVARTRAMLWTGSSMEWGVPYTMMVPPAGVAGPPLVFQHPTSDQPHHTPVDIAERQADDVAVAAHLAGADTMGDVGDPPARSLARHKRAAPMSWSSDPMIEAGSAACSPARSRASSSGTPRCRCSSCTDGSCWGVVSGDA